MTGFGRAEGAWEGWSWAVEARSVNGRNLEVRYRGPPGLESLERAAREGAQARFQRGQLTVGIQARRGEAGGSIRLNAEALERYLAFGEPYVADGRVKKPRLDGLLALKGVIEAEDAGLEPEAQAELEAALAASIAVALDGLLAARREEGRALLGVLSAQVDRIGALAGEARAGAAEPPAAINARVEAPLKALAGEVASEEPIVQEAPAKAVKAEVQEELDRLAGHVDAARALLASDSAVGRRLDFLTQEFMREANTLCSKSQLAGLTALGLDLKAAIEQFREQVQNVE
jgi:uncharacterized protein (TIGR00255 family)